MEGTIRSFADNKKFGFIRPAGYKQGDREVFFIPSSLEKTTTAWGVYVDRASERRARHRSQGAVTRTVRRLLARSCRTQAAGLQVVLIDLETIHGRLLRIIGGNPEPSEDERIVRRSMETLTAVADALEAKR